MQIFYSIISVIPYVAQRIMGVFTLCGTYYVFKSKSQKGFVWLWCALRWKIAVSVFTVTE